MEDSLSTSGLDPQGAESQCLVHPCHPCEPCSPRSCHPTVMTIMTRPSAVPYKGSGRSLHPPSAQQYEATVICQLPILLHGKLAAGGVQTPRPLAGSLPSLCGSKQLLEIAAGDVSQRW